MECLHDFPVIFTMWALIDLSVLEEWQLIYDIVEQIMYKLA